MSKAYLDLDVREDLSRGREPFSRIMAAVASLKPGQGLRLIAPFEPTPLYALLGGQGFSHTAKPQPDGSFEVLFKPGSQPTEANPGHASDSPLALDVRGLEPPEPMVRILEALAVLPRGSSLVAHTDRNPVHLLPHLKERGFSGQSVPQPDGSCLTTIRHV